MSTKAPYHLSLILLAPLTVACATAGAAPEQAAVPAPAPPQAPAVEAPAPVAATMAPTEAIVPLEPKRFDMGRMWTFENAPVDMFEEEYGFRPTQEWLDHVRLASLRLPGCTASFVSSDGLVMSNHHCARSATIRVTKEGETLLDDGFYAATRAEERRVPNYWVDQMVVMEDVTELVDRGIDPTAPDAAQVQARSARAEAIGDSAGAVHGLRCDVTSLYQGGKYSMYCFKRYRDVRLVFVPELQIGYFGGDPDNYTYPRYVLDVSFFRVYDDDGNPYRPTHYFGWSDAGAQDGDPVFVIGNPGSTERLSSMAQLEFLRDHREPFIVHLLKTRTDVLAHYIEHHPEQRSRYINQYFGWMNSLKRFDGRWKALQDPEVMGRKLGWEMQLRAAVGQDPTLTQRYGDVWDELAALQEQKAEVYATLQAFQFSGSTRSRVFSTAAGMLQYAQAATSGAVADSALREARSELEGIEIDVNLDHHLIELGIEDARFLLGDDEPFVQQALAGRTSQEAGHAIVDAAGVVTDPEQRRALLQNPRDILASTNPAIELVRSVQQRWVHAVSRYQQFAAAEQAWTAKLARAMFEVYGTSLPPDGTFTLRIQDGVVKGYDYNGTRAPVWTTFYGMYDRYYSHKGHADWALPERWLNPSPEFDMSTPMNMSSTNDTVGGNSGSCLINPSGDIVGLLFDGNIESLSGYIINEEEVRRSISVRSEAIEEALRHIYDASRIADELGR